MTTGPGKPSRIRITVDFSLPILFFALAWLLGFNYFPRMFYSSTPHMYAVVGLISAAGVVLSILLHEFGHAFAAKSCHLEVARIHLYALGGMAELKHRPVKASHEAWIAISGPFFSLLVAAFCWISLQLDFSPVSNLVFRFLAMTNVLLALFNLFPIYPLDGGRLMRSLIWHFSGTYAAASARTYRISAIILALLCTAGLIVLVLQMKPLVYWVAIWLFYLGYMTLRGKRELFKIPDGAELIHRMNPDLHILEIKAKLAETPGLLERSLVPVFADRLFAGVIHGRVLSEKTDVELLEPASGRFIDLSNVETYTPGLVFASEILPVFDENRYLGLADAHELRFWLLQGFHARIRNQLPG